MRSGKENPDTVESATRVLLSQLIVKYLTPMTALYPESRVIFFGRNTKLERTKPGAKNALGEQVNLHIEDI